LKKLLYRHLKTELTQQHSGKCYMETSMVTFCLVTGWIFDSHTKPCFRGYSLKAFWKLVCLFSAQTLQSTLSPCMLPNVGSRSQSDIYIKIKGELGSSAAEVQGNETPLCILQSSACWLLGGTSQQYLAILYSSDSSSCVQPLQSNSSSCHTAPFCALILGMATMHHLAINIFSLTFLKEL